MSAPARSLGAIQRLCSAEPDYRAGDASGYGAIEWAAESAHKTGIDPTMLRDTYGLTSAEARAAVAMLEHDSVKEAAKVLGVSPNTVRSQLQQIYAKFGVDSRTRFVKVMLGLAG